MGYHEERKAREQFEDDRREGEEEAREQEREQEPNQ